MKGDILKMINSIRDLQMEVHEIKHCIQRTTIDLLDDPNVTKYDLIDAVIKGVDLWEYGMLINYIEEANENK